MLALVAVISQGLTQGKSDSKLTHVAVGRPPKIHSLARSHGPHHKAASLASPTASNEERARGSTRDGKHGSFITQHLHPSLLTHSFCSLQVTKPSPHSGGSHTGYENQEAEDHWGPLPTSGGCCWDIHINLRPAHLQVHLPREAGIGLNSSFYLSPSPVDSNT